MFNLDDHIMFNESVLHTVNTAPGHTKYKIPSERALQFRSGYSRAKSSIHVLKILRATE